MYSQLKYYARDDIRGRCFVDFLMLSSRYLLGIFSFVCFFCFLFTLIKGGYPIGAKMIFFFSFFIMFILYGMIKLKSETRFYFSNAIPVHLKRIGMETYLKYIISEITVAVFKVITFILLTLYPSATFILLFIRIKNAGMAYMSAAALFALSSVLFVTGGYVSALLNFRFAAVDYYILKHRDSLILDSVRKSCSHMDGKMSKYMYIKIRNIKYIVLSLFIFPVPYCIPMKNAIEHEAVLSFAVNEKEKAVTFIIDRRGKFSLG